MIIVGLEYMTIQRLNRVMKYMIITLLIFLMVFSVYFKFDSCNKCSFKVNDKKVSTPEFLQIYNTKCLVVNTTKKSVPKNMLIPNY